VIDVLKEHGALVKDAKFTHSYPVCWRHKTPIIFRATPQWFIGMSENGLRDAAMTEIKQVQWLPDWGQARIEGMVENRPDWCISRQRTWGVPVTFLIHKDTGELHPDTEALVEKVAEKVAESGIQAWFDMEVSDLLDSDADKYEKVPDTLDVWFDSGVTHACVLDTREGLSSPADLYLEGSDQHRGWFQSSLLSSVAMNGKAPYKACLTHGFTVDAQGKKMSKSIGNVISPQDVMKTLGADIIRLWVAATDYRAEMSVSNEILTRTADAYRRIRNTLRFLLSNLNGFDPASNVVANDDLIELDRWVIDRANQLQADIEAAYKDYNFHAIYQKILNFCSSDLGGFYLDVIKDRQYTMAPDSLGRRSCQTAMYHIAEAMVRWLAPVMSFTADEAWGFMPGERSESVFLETWYEGLAAMPNAEAARDRWSKIQAVRSAVSKQLEALRKDGVIGSSLEAEVTLYADEALVDVLSSLGDELRFVTLTSTASIAPLAEKAADAVATELDGLSLMAVKSAADKCPRCWHHRADVGVNAEHPELCGRCVENVAGEGEERRYA